MDTPEERKFLGLSRATFFFLGAFCLLFIWAAGSYAFDQSRTSWPTTVATVIKAWEPDGPRRTATGLQVMYGYDVGNQTFGGQTFFAPGPEQPPLSAYTPSMQTRVFYNSYFPSMSTIAPGSQCRLYVMYMVLAAVALVVTLVVKPGGNTGAEIRTEMPIFLDCLATLIESGVGVRPAFEQATNMCATRCPQLSRQLARVVLELKNNGTALQQSLQQIGETCKSDELKNLGSTLAAAEMTGSSVAYQLRKQSDSLKYTLKAEQLAAENAASNYSRSRSRWDATYHGAHSSQEILDELKKTEEQ